MKDKYMDPQEEAFREAEIEFEIAWMESDCVKQGCSNAKPENWGCSGDLETATDALSCKYYNHSFSNEINMICDFCYRNEGGDCAEGHSPLAGYCGMYIPDNSTPETERIIESLKSAYISGNAVAQRIVNEWVTKHHKASVKLRRLCHE